MNAARLLPACEADLPWLIDVIRELVSCESPSGHREAINACGSVTARRLRELGAAVATIPGDTGDQLRAEIGDGTEQILVLGHLDTVWPVGQLARMPVRQEDGRLYGPGVYDMKAGVGLVLLALRVMRTLGVLPGHRIVVLLTTDEETGSTSGRPVLEAEAGRSRAVLVPEPPLPGGALKTSRKGVGEFVIEAHGIAAHAGLAPESGASAVLELARQILALADLADPRAGVTINPGVISGGTRSNVVADYARALVDVRVWTDAEGARIEDTLGRLQPHDPRVRLQISGGISRPPFERSSGVLQLFALARMVAAELGRELGEGPAAGGSDGNFTAARGVPTLDGLGAPGDGAHALDEHVLIGELPWRAALLAGLMLRIP